VDWHGKKHVATEYAGKALSKWERFAALRQQSTPRALRHTSFFDLMRQRDPEGFDPHVRKHGYAK